MKKSRLTDAVACPSLIERDALYHEAEFRSRMGWGRHAMRTARRQGLKVRYLGGRAYVAGSDFFSYLDAMDRQQAEAASA